MAEIKTPEESGAMLLAYDVWTHEHPECDSPDAREGFWEGWLAGREWERRQEDIARGRG